MPSIHPHPSCPFRPGGGIGRTVIHRVQERILARKLEVGFGGMRGRLWEMFPVSASESVHVAFFEKRNMGNLAARAVGEVRSR